MERDGGRFVSGGEVTAQRRFLALICAENEAFFAQTGRRRTAFVHSYGCQQNVCDGEKLAGMLTEAGYVMIDDPKAADVTVYNTCAVRENAEDRVLGNTGALLASKRKNPEKIICLCGCMIQQPTSAARIKTHFPYVDLLVGTHNLYRFPQLLASCLHDGRRVYATDDSPGEIAEGLPIRRADPIRVGIPVSYGCNNFCTYCVVPYVRGRERSRRAEDVLTEVEQAIAGGTKELTLLGQNVNSYGSDRPGDTPSFPRLLTMACAPEGDYWVRFMTSHPKDAGQPLFDAIAGSPRAAKHLHLPVQSGSDAVLKRMNRRYGAETYLKQIEAARRTVPGLAVTSDIIVGFPGETEADFEQTLALVREVGYDSLFMFIYSKRAGTPAAEWPDQVDPETASERFSRLLALQETISEQKHAALPGRRCRVLVEGYEPRHGLWSGKDDGVTRVLFPGEADAAWAGRFAEVEITQGGRHWVKGKLLSIT